MDRILAGAARVSLDIKLSWRGTCPRRHVYNPRLQRQAGIRGGCHFCTMLYAISQLAQKVEELPQYQELQQKMARFDEEAEKCRR